MRMSAQRSSIRFWKPRDWEGTFFLVSFLQRTMTIYQMWRPPWRPIRRQKSRLTEPGLPTLFPSRCAPCSATMHSSVVVTILLPSGTDICRADRSCRRSRLHPSATALAIGLHRPIVMSRSIGTRRRRPMVLKPGLSAILGVGSSTDLDARCLIRGRRPCRSFRAVLSLRSRLPPSTIAMASGVRLPLQMCRRGLVQWGLRGLRVPHRRLREAAWFGRATPVLVNRQSRILCRRSSACLIPRSRAAT